jgi:hypothetical protein
MSRLLKVHVHADCLLLSESHGKRELRVPVEDRRDIGSVAEALARQIAKKCRLVLVLHDSVLQRRRLRDLPPVAERLLPDLIRQQESRFFRQGDGESLVIDARWESESGRTVAEARACSVPWLERLIAGLTAGGQATCSIVDASGRLQFDLPSIRHVRRRAERRLTALLGCAACMTWTVALTVYLVRLVVTERVLDRELAAVRSPAAAVQTAQRRLRDAEALLAVVDGDRVAQVRMHRRLAELLSGLPDSSYLVALELDTASVVKLEGSAAQPRLLLALAGNLSTQPRSMAVYPPSDSSGWPRFLVTAPAVAAGRTP